MANTAVAKRLAVEAIIDCSEITMLFDVVDASDALKKNFSYLGPGQAPYYWIIIGAEIFLFKAATDLSGIPWFLAFGCVALLMIVCAGRALSDKAIVQEGDEQAQLRIARIVGVAVPLLAAAFCLGRARFNDGYAAAVIGAAFLQVFVFLMVVKEDKKETDTAVNIPQLLVISSSLAFSFFLGLATLSAKDLIATTPMDRVKDPVAEAIAKSEQSVRSAELEAKKKAAGTAWKDPEPPPPLPMSEEDKLKLPEIYARARNTRSALDDESPIPMVPAHKILYEIDANAAAVVPIHHVRAAQAQFINFLFLTALIGTLWLICLAGTIYHSRR